MPLIALSHVSHRFGGPYLLEDVTLTVEKGRRIGVIGQNGTGKSTLLRLLGGVLAPTEGDVFRQRGVGVAMQQQELTYDPGASVRDEMRRLFAADFARAERLAELELRMAEELAPDEQARALAEYERLQQEHTAAGGYDVERRIATVLSSLGLAEEACDQPVEHFSGGERNIVGLAGVLLSDPDVMLLDEPSNHLDVEGIEWFTDFLRHTTATVVMVSHNRYLLDAAVDVIWELRKGTITEWAGNYTAFKEQKEKALELQERRFRSQKRTIDRLAHQARRQKDMANAYDDPGQARRAKQMERRVERMQADLEAPDRAEMRFHASLKARSRSGNIALQVRDYTFAHGDRVLFERAELDLDFGDRVCLVGPNGCGKTTLIRQVLEQGAWDNETLRVGKSVLLGEYRQLHDVLDHTATLLDWAMDVTGLARTPAADLLHRFLFTREDLERPIGTLSGGEKSRLQLARLVHERVNFLILDEPTNHLDLQACEQLEAMLLEFDGTLLIVSHDRYFLEKLVNRVVEVRDRGLHLFRGGFAEWWQSKLEARDHRRKGALELRSRKTAAEASDAPGRSEREARKTEQRERRRAQREVEKAERKIAAIEAEKERLLAAMQAAYGDDGDPEEGRRIAAEIEGLERDLTGWYEQWEANAERLTP